MPRTLSGEPESPGGLDGSTGLWTEDESAADEWECLEPGAVKGTQVAPVALPKATRSIAQELRTRVASRATLDAEEARLLRYAEDLRLWVQQHPRR